MKKIVAFVAMLLAMVALVGAANPNVEIQEKLKEKGYYQGVVDGIMGPGTQNAIRMFQVDNELEPDGVAGEKTLAVLGITIEEELLAEHSPLRDVPSDEEVVRSTGVVLLAKFIQAEAGDQPYETQVAIGAVVLNRLKHENFPNTLASVIFQSDAFITVRDGYMTQAPTENAYTAAAAAFTGEDPTEGCLYYYNPGTETRKYVLEREPKTAIGRYRFCK